MRSYKSTFVICLATTLTVGVGSVSPVAAFENSVVVESKTVMPGQDSVWVGIFISNAVPINQLFLPLEVRSLTPGSFMRGNAKLGDNPAGRVYNSPLSDDSSPCWVPPWSNPYIWVFAAPESVNSCSGPVSGSYLTEPTPDDSFFVSPDAFALDADGSFCGSLDPGEDPPFSDNASCFLTFDVSSVAGQFEIDTCCALGHLRFGGGIIPSFTRGVITIACDCPCHADPECDGVPDIQDLVKVIDRAFRGADGFYDASCLGHGNSIDGRTDVDCSGATDVLDVVRSIAVVLRGADPVAQFCDPCH